MRACSHASSIPRLEAEGFVRIGSCIARSNWFSESALSFTPPPANPSAEGRKVNCDFAGVPSPPHAPTTVTKRICCAPQIAAPAQHPSTASHLFLMRSPLTLRHRLRFLSSSIQQSTYFRITLDVEWNKASTNKSPHRPGAVFIFEDHRLGEIGVRPISWKRTAFEILL